MEPCPSLCPLRHPSRSPCPGASRRLFRLSGAALAIAVLAWGCGGDDGAERGEAVAVTEVAGLTKAAIDQLTAANGMQPVSGPARCDVSLRELTYRTKDPRGEDTILVSAALLVPASTRWTCKTPPASMS